MCVWLLPFIYVPGINYFYNLIDDTAQWYWYDLVYNYYYYGIFTAVLVGLFCWKKLDVRMYFSRINRSEYLPAVRLTMFVYIFSIAAAFGLFYPLSFLVPDFVSFWFLELSPVIYHDGEKYPFIPNLLSFISLVFLAPVTEEFAFRGVLLHRWAEKWSLRTSVIVSSILFGIAHPDPIGATAFSVAMCVVYLKTQSLAMPILCHVLNNLMAWFHEVGYVVLLGSDYEYSLADFQEDWPIAVSAGVISVAWTVRYMVRTKGGAECIAVPQLVQHK